MVMYSIKNWINKIPINLVGRDFIVGDLHGHYTSLMLALDFVNFDEKKDRLFSVGDIVDRGPEVGLCLSLLEKDWFFSVLGNHEYMLLTTLGYNSSFVNNLQSFLYSDRRKIREESKRSFYLDYLDRLKDLPLSMQVKSKEKDFFIFHAQRPVDKQGNIWTDLDIKEKEQEKIKPKKIKNILWSRNIVKEGIFINNINKKEIIYGDFLIHPSTINGLLPFSENIGLTYCGHTILPNILFHKSHIFIDGGKYKGGHLNIINHQDMELFLR